MEKLQVVLYSRAGCCLCDTAEGMLAQLDAEFPLELAKIDIDSDADLQARYCCSVPVVTINGGNQVALRVTEERLRRALRQAQQRSRGT